MPVKIAVPIVDRTSTALEIGANRTSAYIPLLMNKKVAIVANQTSVIFKTNKTYIHLVDSLISLNISVKKVFAPEHGFRGDADAGELIKDGIDLKTGIPIISLYGENKKPTNEQLSGIEIVVFDIQDVGVRFYTYISTLHYVMEACAENNIPLIVLDRPNPNAHYIDGPILEMGHQSFIGMHPIPVVYGMTIGEYTNMINGEKWLKNEINCDLTIVPISNYSHETTYILPIKPSPNLPNDQSIMLYPSLCFFEGTNVSVGRGTDKQFQIYGSPFLANNSFKFTPQPNYGSKFPPQQGVICYGEDLRFYPKLNEINLNWLKDAYSLSLNNSVFYNDFFKKLAGNDELQQQIEQGVSIEEIKKSWEKGLKSFKKTRRKYLLYD
ncbi:MAG: DUF1343 domain-containing protein [Flavobacteriaceae bacterium]|nr:DUF1343 domain-containing protein [Flavobacteriaceae bacterium]